MSLQVSDGPNGIRGNHFFMSTPAKCLPVRNLNCYVSHYLTGCQSSTAIGSTWDPELIHEVGRKLLAEEAKLRSASLVLAPTCNIQRVSYLFFPHGTIL